MNSNLIAHIVVFFALLPIIAHGIESDIAASTPTNKMWKQSDWFGEEGVETVEEEDRGVFTGYHSAISTLHPPGYLEVGVHTGFFGIDDDFPNPGDKDIVDIGLTTFGLIAAANIRNGSPPVKVYYVDTENWQSSQWGEAPFFPSVGGDNVIAINSLECVAESFGSQYFVYAGVTMSGGYAGTYVAEVIIDYNEGVISGLSDWTYLNGPGNPSDNPPTDFSTDIYGIEGYSDRILCATGDSGVISYYDGTAFAHAYVGSDETVYKISQYSGDLGLLFALTGPHGNIYLGNLAAPYWPTFWGSEPYYTLESNDIYDHFVFANYHYFAGASPAAVYREGGESPIGPTGNLPARIFDPPTGVYCLGHIGNLVLAGTGDDGLLYGTRSTGDTWSIASHLGEETKIVSILDLGALYPLLALAGAEGDSGGLYVFSSPNYAVLESSALHIMDGDTHFDKVTWDVEENGGQVIVQVRTSDNAEMSGALPWDIPDPEEPDEYSLNPDTIANQGDVMELLPSVRRGDNYLQYRIVLGSSDTGESPVFKEVRLAYGSLGFDSLLPADEVHAVPNPATGDECRIYYALSADAEVTAEVYDINGRLVWSESENGNGLQPDQFITWRTSNVAPGVYVYRVHARTGNGDTDSAVKKIAVLK